MVTGPEHGRQARPGQMVPVATGARRAVAPSAVRFRLEEKEPSFPEP
jgi:hypothetical protein